MSMDNLVQNAPFQSVQYRTVEFFANLWRITIYRHDDEPESDFISIADNYTDRHVCSIMCAHVDHDVYGESRVREYMHQFHSDRGWDDDIRRIIVDANVRGIMHAIRFSIAHEQTHPDGDSRMYIAKEHYARELLAPSRKRRQMSDANFPRITY